jgi:hypothetical protein
VLYGGVLGVGLYGYVGRGTLCCMAVCWVLDRMYMWGGEHCALWRCVGFWSEWLCVGGYILVYGGVVGVRLNGYVGRGTFCCMAVCWVLD